MRLALPALVMLGLAPPALTLAASGAPPPGHVIDVTLDPDAGTIRGTDRVTLPWKRRVDVALHDGLDVTATCDGRPVAVEGSGDTRTLVVPASCRKDGLATIEVTLSGRIVDPVKDEPSLHFVTGGRTSGLITKDGAFLAGGTGWYPETGDMALFDVSVTVPEAWSVVSQGDAAGQDAPTAGTKRFHYVSTIPADGLALSAGPYVVASRRHGPVTISTWFFQDHADLSDLFLDAAEKEIDLLSSRLGGYPGTKFDVVENFFTTGYGFPTYTLLGKDVIGMGPRALRPGYLDHEIAHVWFGNDVSVDLASGNWCEGLTSYVTNYLNTAAQGPEQALEARQRVSQRYAVDVTPAADVAPRAFREKTDDAGASIGYAKVSMVFHLLERDLGEDVLWAALRDFVARFGGRRASWDDLRACFERASSRDLKGFFAQWIDRPGLPAFALENVEREGDVVTGDVVQSAPFYDLALDVTAEGTSPVTVRVASAGARTPFRLEGAATATRVTLDPAWDVPRRVAPADLPPSLARVLADPDRLVVYGEPPDASSVQSNTDRLSRVAELARSAAGDPQRAMTGKQAAEAEVEASSVLFLGSVADNAWIRRLVDDFDDAGVNIAMPGTFRADGKRYRGPEQSLLVSIPNPHHPEKTWTAWVPNGPGALDSARLLFFYGWDTWVALDSGHAADRATRWPAGPWSVALPKGEPSAADRIMEDVRALTDPRFDGRESGTLGEREVGNLLARRFDALSLEALADTGYQQLFDYTLKDLTGRPLLFWHDSGGRAHSVPVLPASEWLPEPTEEEAATQTHQASALGNLPVVVGLAKGVVYAGSGRRASFAGLDLRDSAVIVRDDRSPGSRERIEQWIDQARLHEAKALIVVRPGSDWPADPGMAIFAASPEPEHAERLKEIAEKGGDNAVRRWIAGERARTPGLGSRGKLPLFFAGDMLSSEMDALGLKTVGARALADVTPDLRLSIAVEHVRDANVLGGIAGTAPKGDAVLLSAHYDGLGVDADGTIEQGAADNAAGVAVVLEVARRLVAKPPARDVIVAALGGEEWGLQGSRWLASAWAEPKLRAVVNVDTLGHAGAPLFVVGRSREPALAATIDAAASAAGLAPGGDIDKYADRDGSDHWPWVGKYPAVDVFQADYKLINSSADTVEKLDPATLAKDADAIEAAVRAIADGP